MKQYHKTRSEANRFGVKAAKAMVKNNTIHTIHPLIAGMDKVHYSEGLVEKAAFVRALQCFRPAQTILESGIGTGSSNNKAMKKSQRDKQRLMVSGGVGCLWCILGVCSA